MGNKGSGLGKGEFISRHQARTYLEGYCAERGIDHPERATQFTLDIADKNGDGKYDKSELMDKGSIALFRAAIRAETGSLEGIPGAIRIAPADKSHWEIGDVIEVWSSSRGEWFDDGVIVDMQSKYRGSRDIYIKVRYSFASAWKWDLASKAFFRPRKPGRRSKSQSGRHRTTTSSVESEEKRSGNEVMPLFQTVRDDDHKHDGRRSSRHRHQRGHTSSSREANGRKNSKLFQEPKEDQKDNKSRSIVAAIEKLEDKKAAAIEAEDFTRASQLRDQVGRMRRELELFESDRKQRARAVKALQQKLSALEAKKKGAIEVTVLISITQIYKWQ